MQYTYLATAWRDWKKPRKSEMILVGDPYEIRSGHGPNISLQ